MSICIYKMSICIYKMSTCICKLLYLFGIFTITFYLTKLTSSATTVPPEKVSSLPPPIHFSSLAPPLYVATRRDVHDLVLISTMFYEQLLH